MSLPRTLNAFCEMLRNQTGARVVLGRPDTCPTPGDDASLCVWPWKLEADPAIRNAPPARPGRPEAAAHEIHFLVLATPALTTDGLAKLDAARKAMRDYAMLAVDGQTVQVVASPLPNEMLAAVFTAAAMPLTLCLSGILRAP
ncbi:MAG: hypothetical protein AB1720_06255 [Pseudomonadota bacterium]